MAKKKPSQADKSTPGSIPESSGPHDFRSWIEEANDQGLTVFSNEQCYPGKIDWEPDDALRAFLATESPQPTVEELRTLIAQFRERMSPEDESSEWLSTVNADIFQKLYQAAIGHAGSRVLPDCPSKPVLQTWAGCLNAINSLSLWLQPGEKKTRVPKDHRFKKELLKWLDEHKNDQDSKGRPMKKKVLHVQAFLAVSNREEFMNEYSKKYDLNTQEGIKAADQFVYDVKRRWKKRSSGQL